MNAKLAGGHPLSPSLRGEPLERSGTGLTTGDHWHTLHQTRGKGNFAFYGLARPLRGLAPLGSLKGDPREGAVRIFPEKRKRKRKSGSAILEFFLRVPY